MYAVIAIVSRLHPQNCLGVRSFAEQYMCPSLVEACNKYLQKHFKEVMKTEEFFSLPITDMLEIIGRDELNVSSEEQVMSYNSMFPPHLKSGGGVGVGSRETVLVPPT